MRQGVHYLLSDQQVRVQSTDKQHFRHFAMQAVNEKGVEAIANIEIRFDPSYQTLTLHSITLRRGERLIPKLSAASLRVLQREKELDYLIFDGSKTAHVFLEDVRVGDIVEYAYTLQGSNPVFGGRQFGHFDLQWGAPVHRLYARLLWPAGRELLLTPRNTSQQPLVQEIDGYREHVWEARKRPGLQFNSEVPGWYDPYPAVQWGEFKTWTEVAQWALPLYQTPAALSGELQGEVQRIAKAHASAPERLVAALAYVQKNIRYLGVEVGAGSHAPNAPATVLARRFGDCKDKTLLTLTLLRALGIEAQAALVNTQTRRGVQAQQPSPGLFNHVLVLARVGGRDYWVDPTRAPQQGRLDALSQPDYGVALVVGATTQDLQAMVAGEAALYKRRIHTVFDTKAGLDKPARFTVTTHLQGASAEAMRNSLAEGNVEDLQKNYLNYYAQYYPGVAVDRPFEISQDVQANRLTLIEHYLIKDFWVDASEHKRQEARIHVPELKSYLQAPRDAIRQAPLALNHPIDIEHITEVLLPEDWTIRADTERVTDPAFELERKVAATSRHLTLSDRYRSRADHVSADNMAAYVANLERGRDALAYVIYKGSTAAAEDGWLGQFNWTIAVLALMLTGLWCWLALKVYRYDPAGPGLIDEADARPLGGWLILAGIGFVITPFRLVQDFWPALPAYGNQHWASITTLGGEHFHALMAPLLLTELALIIGQVIFAVLVIVLYFQRRRSLPRVYQIFGGATLLLGTLDHLATAAIPSISDAVTATDWRGLLKQAFFLALWMAYFSLSSRVSQTFVKTRRQGAVAPAAPTAEPLPAIKDAVA